MLNTAQVTMETSQRGIAPSPVHADWTLSVLTHAATPSARAELRTALTSFLAARGLTARYSADSIAIEPGSDAITDEDRGAVLGWLCSRPEVRFLQVSRSTSAHACVVACGAPKAAALAPSAGRQQGAAVPDEDQSQEPPWWQA